MIDPLAAELVRSPGRWRQRLKRLRVAARLALIALATTLLLEVCLQLVVAAVLQRGRLFTTDTVLGWKTLPSLALVRRNADGAPWRIQTNRAGFRSALDWPAGARRILVLGDSFAFGEGVSLEDRFDTLLTRSSPSWQPVNLGVMGFGTDQEMLAGFPYLNRLRPHDAVILLFCGNDAFDVLRHTFAGRPKPWIEVGRDRPLWHAPDIGPFTRLRNRSYLFAWLLATLERKQSSYSEQDVLRGMHMVESLLLQYLRPIAARGVIVIVARHQDATIARSSRLGSAGVAEWWKSVCTSSGFACAELDSQLVGHPAYLTDGHWNPLGHRIVAGVLGDMLRGQ